MVKLGGNRRRLFMRSKFSIQLVVTLFFFLHSIQYSRTQTTTSGELTGVVSDPTGAVVPDANVAIRDTTKGTTQATKTDTRGVYQFFFVAPGNYALTVSHHGFREERQKINVLLGPAGLRDLWANSRFPACSAASGWQFSCPRGKRLAATRIADDDRFPSRFAHV
jgi:Carboxypeptidase regulatory-like domain